MLKGECYSNLLFKMNLKSTKCLPPETVKQQLMAEPFYISVFSDPTIAILYISIFLPDHCHVIYQYLLTRQLPFYASVFI
jgi:hypothetical protein